MFLEKMLHKLFYFDTLFSISVISNRILNSDFHLKKSYLVYVQMMQILSISSVIEVNTWLFNNSALMIIWAQRKWSAAEDKFT